MNNDNLGPVQRDVSQERKPPALAQMFSKMAEARQQQQQQRAPYKPIVKCLQEIGLKVQRKDVDGVESIVIPVQEMIMKEWEYMGGGFEEEESTTSEEYNDQVQPGP